MKRVLASILTIFAFSTVLPSSAFAAGGVYASGGGKLTIGQTATVTISASGADFKAVEGTISKSGPIDITSFSVGDATWTTKPALDAHFVGMVTSTTNSLQIATIKVRATGVGNASISLSSVRLALSGSPVGTGAGSASFTIEKAPELPGAVKVSSSSHPDPAAAYEATTIALSWNKESGVDNFSYLLDQAEKTTPAAKATDAATSATFADKAVGTYYFHIRAHKTDGWGTTTHFKITVKEPDAKVDATLSKPSEIKFEKTADFINSITDGTVTGMKITGKTEPGFTATLTLTPAPTIPAGKTLSAVADNTGVFEILLDYPIAAGFHKLTIQGSLLKVLTPVSDELTFEISQKEGGSINILTDGDAQQVKEIVKSATDNAANQVKKSKINSTTIFFGLIGLFLVLLLVVGFVYLRNKKSEKQMIKIVNKKNAPAPITKK